MGSSTWRSLASISEMLHIFRQAAPSNQRTDGCLLDIRAIGFQNWPSPHLLPFLPLSAFPPVRPLISNESFVRSLVRSASFQSPKARAATATDADEGSKRAGASAQFIRAQQHQPPLPEVALPFRLIRLITSTIRSRYVQAAAAVEPQLSHSSRN